MRHKFFVIKAGIKMKVMASYLLLRDNKESGPYSFEQLLQLGFKPYDLIWIQGKSAAWRYPYEVSEFKPYAPAIEEQPFDRFYKKKTGEKKEDNLSILTELNSEPNATAESYYTNIANAESFSTGKSIHVTLPQQKKQTKSVQETFATEKTIIINENPAAAQVKYSQPLDEIKEMYVKSFLERKQKIARKNFLFQTLKKASVFILIAVGILIGFILRSNSSKKRPIANQKTQQTQLPAKDSQQNLIATTPVVTGKKDTVSVMQPQRKEDVRLSAENPVSISESKPLLQKSMPSNPKKEFSFNDKKINTDQSTPGIVPNSLINEKNKKDPEEIRNEKPNAKDEIFKQISLTGSDYKRGAFGGIRDLQLTVTNHSKYILDNVMVELQYLKPSEQPLMTENVQFHSISPNGSLTIAIPPTSRGIKVLYRIVKIECREMGDDSAGIFTNNN